MTRTDNRSWDTVDPRRRYPNGPLTDDESDAVLVVAVNDMIMLRSPMWHGDAGAELHALASLNAQIAAWLPDVVADARDQDYTWTQIAALLGTRASTTQRRYAHHALTRRPPLDPD